MTPGEVVAGARQALGDGARCEEDGTTVTIDLPTADWLAGLEFARDTAGCDFFDWLTAVDEGEAGFAVVAHLYSIEGKCHLLARTALARNAPVLPSAVPVFRGAAWHEREVHEMFGVMFEGHPDLAPLLLPDGFEGHPLRKDFELTARAERDWPGAVEPGDAKPSSRRRLMPPGGAGRA